MNSTPQAVADAINAARVQLERLGLEVGISSAWFARGLLAKGLPAIVIEVTQAAGALKTGFRNKTDRNGVRPTAVSAIGTMHRAASTPFSSTEARWRS